MDFSDKRQSYERGSLDKASAPSNPFDLLRRWISDAIEQDVVEPYAMSLATSGSDMKPSVRTVLLREVTESGLVFYTNYLSSKGEDIDQNPQAEALFFWHDMQRQVRLNGKIKRISRGKTEAYFQKRPYDSQIGAWVSEPQSGVVESRAAMDAKFEQLKARYPEDKTVPTPDFWGGYEITATEIEFWQGRPNRLHDRLLYTSAQTEEDAANNKWSLQRLLP